MDKNKNKIKNTKVKKVVESKDEEVFRSKEEKVAESAENQLISLKEAENSKIEQVLKERDKMITYRKTLSAIIYAAMEGYADVYPQAEGFIEGRIKSLDSLHIKAKNEITEILGQIEENPNIDQNEILKKISQIDFKDIFAFSVISTNPPEHFKTGNDEKNAEFTNYSSELIKSKKRIGEHEDFIKTSNEQVIQLTNIIRSLRDKENFEDSKEKIDELKTEILSNRETLTEDELNNLLNKIVELSNRPTSETVQRELSEKLDLLDRVKSNIEYSKGNLERTEKILKDTLRDLQYKMSEYYVENLSKFSIFKFWGTTPIRTPKRMVKPGFRAVNTGYKVKFTTSNKQKQTMKFEVQGKGGIDYQDAEFSAVGAEYHEDQKTKEGIISKNIVMPDFTIIGNDLTKKIEREVTTRYGDISSIDDLEELGFNLEAEELKKYKQKISEEIQEKNGTNKLSKRQIKNMMSKAVLDYKNSIIQKEIEHKINGFIDAMADNDSFINDTLKREANKLIYEEERKEIEEKIKNSKELDDDKSKNYTDEEINHMARVRVLYRLKEEEIKSYAETSIPMFFRANLPKNENEDKFIYWFSTGESIYRFFINKLNGLKDINGKYKYEPQEQQKRALIKLTGLFEEDLNNFYTYDKDSKTFGGLEKNDEVSGLEENDEHSI